MEKELYISIGDHLDHAKPGKLFGKPCYKVNGKAFMCFFQNEIVCKLGGELHTKALNLEGAHLFDPSGKKRPMKEWIQIPFTHKHMWKKFAESSLIYVRNK